MKKLICAIPVTILIYILLFGITVNASTTDYTNIIIYKVNSNNMYFIGCSNNPVYIENTYEGLRLYYYPCSNYYATRGFASYDAAYNYIIENNLNTGSGASILVSNTSFVTAINGSIQNNSNTNLPDYVYSTYDDYLDSLVTPTPTPTPIPSMWDKFYEWYYKIYGYYPADDSLFGYFKSLFDDDQESSESGGPSQHSISTHRPTPIPTPTPIPYSVIIQPNYDSSGNVINYTYNYSYTSESGDTIIATSPPDNSVYNNNDDDETYNPDPLTVPTSALDTWYMFAYDENEHPNPELQNPNNDFGTGMKYIEDNINEYDKPIDYIMSVVNFFPDKWLILFGMGIGLIFIAGIISRFLS